MMDHVFDHVPGDSGAAQIRPAGLLLSPRVAVFETATKYGAWTPRGDRIRSGIRARIRARAWPSAHLGGFARGGPIGVRTARFGVGASDLAGAGIAEH